MSVTPEAVVLWLHIAAGTVALLSGAVALVTSKGGRRHRRAGTVFVWSMAVVVGSVVPLVAFEPGSSLRQFLVLVAVFSGYLAFSGYRSLSRKRPTDGPEPVDWVGVGLVVPATLGLGVWGVLRLVDGDPFGTVLVVFGGIGLALGVSDVLAFRDPDRREPWLLAHLGRMVAAYIATVSAVSAVNLTLLPPVVRWLWPTAAGVPLILYWQAKYVNRGPLVGLVSE